MTTPGIEVRPIRNAIGDSHFCEVFLNDVVIPAANLVGAENAGWQVAQATLGAERGMTMLELAERLGNAGFRWLVQIAAAHRRPGRRRPAGAVRDRDHRAARAVPRPRRGREAGAAGPADASIVKLYYSELLQRMTDFGAEVGGLAAHTVLPKPMSSGWESGAWVLDFIGSWEWTIPGGSSEIQRTIIGERGLGLPREPAWRDGSEFAEIHDELRVGRPRPARQGSAQWTGRCLPRRGGPAWRWRKPSAAPAPRSPRRRHRLEELGRAASATVTRQRCWRSVP